MKGMINLIVTGVFVLATSTSMAATKTDLASKWICTTNASSSSINAEKATDAQMEKAASSAVDAFAFASANCRDCTKITCEVQN